MKSLHAFFLASITTFGIVEAVVGDANQGPAKVSATLSERVAQLESTWKDGGGAHQYYLGVRTLAHGLEAYEQGEANTVGLALLSNLLSRKLEKAGMHDADYEVGAADLFAIRSLTRYLLAHDNVSTGVRHAKVGLSAEALGAVRAELQPDYVAKLIFMNLMPPPGGEGPRVSGMDPDAVADPVAREKYKASIRENNTNSLINQRQHELQLMEIELSLSVVDFMRRVASTDLTAEKIVQQAMLDARLSDAEKSQVMPSKKP